MKSQICYAYEISTIASADGVRGDPEHLIRITEVDKIFMRRYFLETSSRMGLIRVSKTSDPILARTATVSMLT